MTLKCGFYNSLEGDRVYYAEDLSNLMSGVVTDGVFQSIGDALACVENTGMNVGVSSGRAWFNNTWLDNDDIYVVTIPDADVALPRIDSIVVKVDTSIAVRNTTIEVITGEPASSPVHPTLTDTSLIFYHRLADVQVPAGATAINASRIFNAIGTDETPFVTGILETIDMTWLFAQWQGDFDAWFDNLVNELTTNQATNLQAQIDEINNLTGDISQTLSGNLIKNHPSIELADGVKPIWWDDPINQVYLYEVLAADESVSNSPNERVLKFGTGPFRYDGYSEQQFALADEALLYNGVHVSLGMLVYRLSGTGDLTASIRNSVGTAIGSATFTLGVTGYWQWIEVTDVEITSDFSIRFEIDALSTEFLIAKPTLNVGPIVAPWSERKLVAREFYDDISVGDTGGAPAGWQTIDLSTIVNPNTAIIQLATKYANEARGSFVRIRRYGDANDVVAMEAVCAPANNVDTYGFGIKKLQISDDKKFQFYCSALEIEADNLYFLISMLYDWA